MSSGSSDSESISECEFKTISESDKESIRGCYNNEPEYSQEGVILRIHTSLACIALFTSQNQKLIKFLKFLPLTVPIILFIYYV